MQIYFCFQKNRPLPGNKKHSRPIIGTRVQMHFVVPPKFSGKAALWPLYAGVRGDFGKLPYTPAPEMSSPIPNRMLSAVTSSLWIRVIGYSFSIVAISVVPQTAADTQKVTCAGLMISRQARSPRWRPWINTSAVATFVATGMLFKSQFRSRSLI